LESLTCQHKDPRQIRKSSCRVRLKRFNKAFSIDGDAQRFSGRS
jgi:hypothetical protein